jgi:hypothetical protein
MQLSDSIAVSFRARISPSSDEKTRMRVYNVRHNDRDTRQLVSASDGGVCGEQSDFSSQVFARTCKDLLFVCCLFSSGYLTTLIEL